MGSEMQHFNFPIVIIDEDFRSENTSGLGIRALADTGGDSQKAPTAAPGTTGAGRRRARTGDAGATQVLEQVLPR